MLQSRHTGIKSRYQIVHGAAPKGPHIPFECVAHWVKSLDPHERHTRYLSRQNLIQSFPTLSLAHQRRELKRW